MKSQTPQTLRDSESQLRPCPQCERTVAVNRVKSHPVRFMRIAAQLSGMVVFIFLGEYSQKNIPLPAVSYLKKTGHVTPPVASGDMKMRGKGFHDSFAIFLDIITDEKTSQNLKGFLKCRYFRHQFFFFFVFTHFIVLWACKVQHLCEADSDIFSPV